MIYGFFPDPSMDQDQRQLLEYLINDEIAKRGIAVRVNEVEAMLNFIPTWETGLNDAVDAGIERFQTEE
jgi:hypothetical protein